MAAFDFLGFGLTAPFRRDRKSDFASTGGKALLKSAVRQVLGTRAASDFSQGELPWRTEFGSLLYLLAHHRNDQTLRELAHVYIRDALRRWEPRIEVTGFSSEVIEDGEGNKRLIKLRYDVIQRNFQANQVILEGIEDTLTV